MGATFPLLTAHLVRVRAEAGLAGQRDNWSLELLYGINTVGAVMGAFSTSFFLLPAMGVLNSNTFAALLNLAIAGVGYWLSRNALSEAKVAASEEEGAAAQAPLPAASRRILLMGALIGFSSIGAEIVWSKYLGIFFGTNIYGLGLILSLYLTGIALGSFLSGVLSQRFRDGKTLFLSLVIAALAATFLASRLLNVAPVAANTLAHYLAPHVSLLLIKCVLAALILFLPTLLYGAAFPLMIRVSAGDDARRLSRVASLGYALNTIGGVAASCIAGIWMVPTLGSAFTLRLCFFLLGVGAIYLVVRDGHFVGRVKQRLLATASAALAVCLVFSAVDFRNIIKSAYVQALEPGTPLTEVLKAFSQDFEEFKLIVEGETAVTSLSHDPADGSDYRKYMRLKSNGLNESVYKLDDLQTLPKYEALLGFLPYLFVRSPQSAFVVGYGGGYTADFLSRINLKKVDVVELEPGILEAADVVYSGNNPILKRQNLQLRIEDARYVLAVSKKARYDIIVSQPSHSWLSGVANLFTKDFFEIVRGRLTERGVFSQWLNLYNIDESTLKSILHTFYSVFPYGSVFTDYNDSQMIMIGSNHPLELNVQKLKLLTENAILRKQLSQLPFESPYDFLTNFSLGRTQVVGLAAGAAVNTDDNAYAETHQSKLFYKPASTEFGAETFLRRSYAADFTDVLEPSEANDPKLLFPLLKALHRNRKFDKFFVASYRLEHAVAAGSGSPEELMQVYVLGERFASAIQLGQEISAKPGFKLSDEGRAFLLRAFIEAGRPDEALKLARGKGGSAACYEAYARYRLDPAWAKGAEAKRVIDASDRHSKTCGHFADKLLGELRWARGDVEGAAPLLQKYLEVAPTDGPVLAALAAIYEGQEGSEWGPYYRQLLKNEKTRLANLADYYRQGKLEADSQALSAKSGAL
jgi:spermidine synthase